MVYVVYSTTNLINNKYYIGVHKTDDVNDDYMGSGKLIRYAIAKYGVENFRKDVIGVYEKEMAFLIEKWLVNPDDENCYNIKPGGVGGSKAGMGYFPRRSLTSAHKRKLAVLSTGRIMPQTIRERIKKKLIGHPGASMNESARRKISIANKGNQHVKDRFWHHNPLTGETKMLKVSESLDGFVPGRGRIKVA